MLPNILAEPLYLQVWVFWLIVTNFISLVVDDVDGARYLAGDTI